MDFLPEEEIRPRNHFHFAAMIDFLFLMMAIFATLAISRSNIHDFDVHLVQKAGALEEQENTPVNISIAITKEGNYEWISELNKYLLSDVKKVQEEIIRRYELGMIPKNKEDTKVLLYIDQEASWQKIAELAFAIKEIGFSAHPVYEQTE